MSQTPVTVRLTQGPGYQFNADFGAGAPLRTDLPPPLGEGSGPSPEHLLAAAVGNCLSASLAFALRKYRQEPGPISCEVQLETGRNAEGRVRVTHIAARLTLGQGAAPLQQLDRVLGQFESFCTVTESVRLGIPVTVAVFDAEGAQLK